MKILRVTAYSEEKEEEMKQAIIDIGSNSMRLMIYEVDGEFFKLVFKEKVMAALAGYVKNGILSPEGIECAYEGLLDFKDILEYREVDGVAVFATASMRNIHNADEALKQIKLATGFSIEVLSGEEEALFSYYGAMSELALNDGVFVDIGGASTELVVFEEEKVMYSESFQVGALSLFKDCVKKILPGKGSLKKIEKQIKTSIDKKKLIGFGEITPLVCVGGTSRALLKIAKKLFKLDSETQSISREQYIELCQLLCERDSKVIDLILKLAPDRVHTLLPGAMILGYLADLFDVEEILVSKYGLREGYLCHMIKETASTTIHKTVN